MRKRQSEGFAKKQDRKQRKEDLSNYYQVKESKTKRFVMPHAGAVYYMNWIFSNLGVENDIPATIQED